MTHIAGLLLPLLLLPAAPIPAERKFDPDAAAKAVAPFLDERIVAVVHVDLTRFDVDAIYKQLTGLASLKPNDFADLKKVLADGVKKLIGAGGRDLFVVVSLADVPERALFVVVPLETGADPKTILGLKGTFKAIKPDYEVEQVDQAIVAGAEPTLRRLKILKPVARPEVAKAFAAAGDGLGQVVVLASADARKGIEEALPMLPPELGGGSVKPLTHGLQWAAIKVETAPKISIHCIYQATDKEAAKALHDMTVKAGKALLEQKLFHALFTVADKLVEALTPRLDGERLTTSDDKMILTKAGTQLAIRFRDTALRTSSMNSLKQLALMMHQYHDTHGRFPAVANFDKQNKPLLSWRVHLLPHLGEEKLYKEFHLDEPWDSEHNKKLIAKMPKVFANPYNLKLAADGKTTYLVPVYKDAQGITAVFTGDKRSLPIPAAYPDGASNTVLLTDVDDDAAVIWTKPDDLKLDPKNPHKSLGARHGERYLFAFADCSTHLVTKKIDKNTLWAIFTANGGEAVNLP